MILALAWRNLWRQPRRTILSSLAIAFTSMFLIFMPSLQAGSYTVMIENTLRLYDGYAEIQQPGYHDNPEIRNSIRNYSEIISRLKKQLPVEYISARAVGSGILAADKRSFGAQIIGVMPDAEKGISTIPGNIHQGRFLKNHKADEIVLGETLAKNLQVKVGDRVTLLGMGRDGSLAADSLMVVGIFTTGVKAMDRLFAEMPLGRFQESFSMQNQVHSIVLSGKDVPDFQPLLDPIGKIADEYHLVTLDWKALQPGLLQGIILDISSALIIYLAMVVVVTFSLLNSLLMSVLERTREFGVLLALGMRPGVIGRMVWVETFLIILFGLSLGILLGYGITDYFSQVGIHFESAQEIFERYNMPGAMYPLITPLTLLAGPLIIGLCILLAGIFPVVRIYRMQPVPAMRTI